MSSDPLTQSQREALVCILVLGMYSDSHLSLAEDEAIHKFLDDIGWESGVGRSNFLTDAITKATAISNDVDLAHFIGRNAAMFDTPESRQLALDALTRFLKVDGVAEAEAPLLAQISQALKD